VKHTIKLRVNNFNKKTSRATRLIWISSIEGLMQQIKRSLDWEKVVLLFSRKFVKTLGSLFALLSGLIELLRLKTQKMNTDCCKIWEDNWKEIHNFHWAIWFRFDPIHLDSSTEKNWPDQQSQSCCRIVSF